MLRSLLPALGLLALVPAAASAAPFGEPPLKAVSGAATCLRATGAPGELVRSTRNGAEILQAGAAGLTPVANLPLAGETGSCPRAAARPGGAGIVAFFTSDPANGDSLVQGRLREPGGAWGQTTELLRTKQSASGTVPAVAVSERGDGLVASAGRSGSVVQILAARRTAGSAFGPAETLFSARSNPDSETRVRAGMSAGGEAVVAWSFQPGAGGPRELWATIATPGAAFHAPVRIGLPRASSPFDLAVGDGGTRADRLRERRRPARGRARPRRGLRRRDPGRGRQGSLRGLPGGGRARRRRRRGRVADDARATAGRDPARSRSVRRARDRGASPPRSRFRGFSCGCSSSLFSSGRLSASSTPEVQRRTATARTHARRSWPMAARCSRGPRRRRVTASGGTLRARRRCRSAAAPPSCASTAPSCATSGR